MQKVLLNCSTLTLTSACLSKPVARYSSSAICRGLHVIYFCASVLCWRINVLISIIWEIKKHAKCVVQTRKTVQCVNFWHNRWDIIIVITARYGCGCAANYLQFEARTNCSKLHCPPHGVQVICLFAIHFTWNSTAIHLDWIHTDNRRSRMNIAPHQANLPSCTCPCKRSVSIQSCLSQQCGSINIHKYAGMRCRS